jgi:AcrR family transcriptional regulator
MRDTPSVRELRRAQIIATARALVAEGGLEALTFGTLEMRLAFTRGVITYHFQDKSEILAAVLESAVADLDRATFTAVEATETFPGKVRAALSSKVLGFLHSTEARSILVSFWPRLAIDPDAAALNACLFAHWRQQSAQLFRQAIAEGAISRDVVIDEAAALLVAAVLGIVLQASFSPDAIDTEACITAATQQVLLACGYRGEHGSKTGPDGTQPACSQPAGAVNAPSSRSPQP